MHLRPTESIITSHPTEMIIVNLSNFPQFTLLEGPREPLIYHSMSTNSSILIRENTHIGSFVGSDLAYKEVHHQALWSTN